MTVLRHSGDFVANRLLCDEHQQCQMTSPDWAVHKNRRGVRRISVVPTPNFWTDLLFSLWAVARVFNLGPLSGAP